MVRTPATCRVTIDPMNHPIVSQATLAMQLVDLGVEPDGVLLVHTSFSRIRPVDGGPQGVIAALRHAIGAQATLVMPSMSDDDDYPFDPKTTRCTSMGVVADTFWRLPGVLRSNSPHAFAALGPRAVDITADHPVDVPHGVNSPVGRVHQLNGQILLWGVGHDANTTIHLAESVGGERYRRRKYATVIERGQPVRRPYDEIDHCCEKFNLVDEWLEVKGLQRRLVVGHAEARLFRSRDLIHVVLERLREDENVFLHPPGIDVECDEARASLSLAQRS
jgi:aminoglycoside 3-N-acetyltransferase